MGQTERHPWKELIVPIEQSNEASICLKELYEILEHFLHNVLSRVGVPGKSLHESR
jgi:hypothetical protein